MSNPNAMVFGTNTTLGVSAGAGATSAPAIVVGYKRQEAVLMPLVAAARAKGGDVTSCSITQSGGSGAEHPCVLVGRGVVRGGGESDSLSVLASFGTEGKARTTGANAPEAGGRITQYFATGLAARRLAERAGAASVATGTAAVLSASGWTEEQLEAEVEGRRTGREAVAQRIEKAGDAGFRALLPKMDAAAGTAVTRRFERLCATATTAAECANRVRETRELDDLRSAEVDAAAKVPWDGSEPCRTR